MLDILYENKNLIICVKPVGLSSQKSAKGGEDMIQYLNAHFAQNGENNEAFPVHRLDSSVGGVMIYAKNKKYAAKLSQMIAYDSANADACFTSAAAKECDHGKQSTVSNIAYYENQTLRFPQLSFAKEYLAVVHGIPQQSEGVFEDLLYHDRTKNKTYVVSKERKGVRKAALYYQLQSSVKLDGNDFSLIRIKLFTGRTHQIRVQFASRKMPLAGDGKYGAKDGIKEIGLWSFRISLTDKNGRTDTYEKLPSSDSPFGIFGEIKL